ncbi:hemolysin-type calcium-binding repeat 2 copies family protein [Asticcacaulis biprosthecium C19]|uniref:Hemolysin-type calcium-binding repeat 2 copies family protein n=1 Tax=Asticcacaulis biprosthecium C19 TaxID=715226 RepID=F4QNV6_9CAUL|nr:calcium-binding protein [Asticcacaulis biprosthecium]EGF91014.1 hemolysin-type calcium-binding repeat 2 copies family protein [Asticcacaulis biprosthecium C19]
MAYFNGNGQSNLYNGGVADDVLYGNNGNDTLNGGDGNDYIDGGNNNDVLAGGNGHDTLLGGGGSDVLNAGAGNDLVDGGAGVDTVSYAGAVNGMWIELNQGATAGFSRDGNLSGAMGTDSLRNLENVVGSDFSDIIKGNSGNNLIQGGNGYDTLYASRGIDTLDGGVGGGSANFSDISGLAATVNLTTGAYSLNAGNYGTLISIDDATGTALNDSFTGNSGRNVLDGAAGNDTIAGGGGHDDVWGGAGADRLIADGGNDRLTGNYSFAGYGDNATDTFVIRTNAGAVTISDFKLGIDKLDVSDFGLTTGSTWVGSAVQVDTNTVLTLTQGANTVTVTLQGVVNGHLLQVSDMIGGTSALIAPPPQPAFSNGGNGLLDIFVVDPQLGDQTFLHFENGLDKIDISLLQGGGWGGHLANVPGTTDAQLVFSGPQGEHFTITLPGMPYYQIDASDYIL